jgi:hypothetical protein
VPVAYLDARHIEPSSASFLHALAAVMRLPARASPLRALSAGRRRRVILLDTYERLGPLDAWVRDTFLPGLSAHATIVFAGRKRPSGAWRVTHDGQPPTRFVALRNLSPAESRELLRRRQVPSRHRRAILGFTHGHPLALVLLAEVCAQNPQATLAPEETPDVIQALLQQFLEEVPGRAHRAALEACALVCTTTECLLEAMLEVDDAHDLFEWLRGLSFIESGAEGLFPHDLAREILASELRWRNPERRVTLKQRAQAYYNAQLVRGRGRAPPRYVRDFMFLLRDNPIFRRFWEWADTGFMIDSAGESDFPILLTMVERHEGKESASLAARWFSRQPRGVQVVRDGRRVAGFLATVTLDRSTPRQDIDSDPAAAAAWRYLEQSGPLRPGEVAALYRFWMAGDAYQGVSPVQAVTHYAAIHHDLTQPRLAASFLPTADPDFWLPMADLACAMRVPGADFVVGGRSYAIFLKDWRRLPPAAWLERLAENAAGLPAAAEATPASVDPPVALSLEGFADAVRGALRHFARPHALRKSPLLRSRLVLDRASAQTTPEERIVALQRILRDAAESLRADPRGFQRFQALDRTYFHPAASQEDAAEDLGRPFSTYRYHLTRGVAEVIDLLWHRELGDT